MTDKQISEFLASERGIANANRFIKAAKEHRLIASVKYVSSSGMSREIFFGEVVQLKDCKPKRHAIYQFNWFFEQLGWSTGKRYSDSIKVGGCGMNMIFHTFYSVMSILKYHGFKVPSNWAHLVDDYLLI